MNSLFNLLQVHATRTAVARLVYGDSAACLKLYEVYATDAEKL